MPPSKHHSRDCSGIGFHGVTPAVPLTDSRGRQIASKPQRQRRRRQGEELQQQQQAAAGGGGAAGLLSTGFCATHSPKFHRLVPPSASPRVPLTEPLGYRTEPDPSCTGEPEPAGEVGASGGVWRSWSSRHAVKLQDLTVPHTFPPFSRYFPSFDLFCTGFKEDNPTRTDP